MTTLESELHCLLDETISAVAVFDEEKLRELEVRVMGFDHTEAIRSVDLVQKQYLLNSILESTHSGLHLLKRFTYGERRNHWPR